MPAAVTPEDVSEVSRNLAEAGGKLRMLAAKLQRAEGPLATLASLRIEALLAQTETCLQSLTEAAELVTSVTTPD